MTANSRIIPSPLIPGTVKGYYMRSYGGLEQCARWKLRQHRGSADENNEMKMADLNKGQQQQVSTRRRMPPRLELQFSIFGNNGSLQHTAATSPNGQYSSSPEQAKNQKGVLIGAFLSDEDDTLENDLRMRYGGSREHLLPLGVRSFQRVLRNGTMIYIYPLLTGQCSVADPI
ncbi:hypothetical protein M378DRAFT_291993 [Amanita muscaria Koide BX008]|uniref:Uncharacterized protein n=1 Tax=Amanita muscaria (strain Koide BX008) TaxID=946122 RepID=A0A0C2WC18_AMAMK|nr:hypothetical protein M378DRAFT_291993 [Amanita muscaria Koide BX008]